MYYTYTELMKKYKNKYQIKKAVLDSELQKVKPGLYTDSNDNNILGELYTLRNDIVLTLQSAFYYYGLTDYIPEDIILSTPKNAYPIQIEGVRQIFMTNNYHSIGVVTVKYQGYSIKFYVF